jgi:hypothetical protein
MAGGLYTRRRKERRGRMKRGPSTAVGMTECEITKREEKRGPSTAVGMTEREERVICGGG